MNAFKFISPVTNFVKDHSTVLLTIAGGTGVVATTLSAIRCTKKHEMNISAAEYEWSKRDVDEPLPTKDRVFVAMRSYWPTIILGAATITCFVANGVISERKIAGLGTAYNVAVTSFNEYKKSVGKRLKETDIPEKTENSGHKESPDETEKSAPDIENAEKITKTGNGDTLFKEPICGRLFYSSPEAVRDAINSVNADISQGTVQTLNDLYDALGLPSSWLGDDFMWDVMETGNISVVFGSGVYMGREPYILLDHRNMPMYMAPAFR